MRNAMSDRRESPAVTQSTSRATWWSSAVAIFTPLVTFASGVFVAFLNHNLEDAKMRSSLVMEAAKACNKESAEQNLRFLFRRQRY
jgi:hypothetical protein